MKRRGFFKTFASVVAAVAIAPEIAFNVRLPLYDKGDVLKELTALLDQRIKEYTESWVGSMNTFLAPDKMWSGLLETETSSASEAATTVAKL